MANTATLMYYTEKDLLDEFGTLEVELHKARAREQQLFADYTHEYVVDSTGDTLLLVAELRKKYGAFNLVRRIDWIDGTITLRMKDPLDLTQIILSTDFSKSGLRR